MTELIRKKKEKNERNDKKRKEIDGQRYKECKKESVKKEWMNG